MPYIKMDRRRAITNGAPPQSAGELNYAITMLVQAFVVQRMQMTDRDLKYCMINDVLGALEGAKAEFYRRVAVPYEQGKIDSNGDVYYLEIPGSEE
ncbi:MAG: DUF6899 family protein [Candidatus Thorarchaeota archaeon]|jgi:hypothetical protein